jgi:hypothetical protein
MLAKGVINCTWVFRSDQTGYLLLDCQFHYSFAYTVSYSKNEAQVTIYEYGKGYTADEGFSNNPMTADFNPTILPKGVTMKAKITDNLLELEGWDWGDANFGKHPVVFHRQR